LFRAGKHGLAPTQPKIVEMGKPEGEHVHRVLGDDVVPDRERAVEVTCDPGIQCLHVSPLTRSRLCRHHGGGLDCLGGSRDVGELVGEHRQVAGKTMRETERGIGGKRAGEMTRGIGAKFQISQDRPVKGGSGFPRRSRYREPMLVRMHSDHKTISTWPRSKDPSCRGAIRRYAS
jgi:hypothetical protein